MDATTTTILWRQLGAAIDMLENAITACPEQLWSDRSRQPEFWYLAFHTLFYLDLYLSPSEREFSPPAPFTLAELDPAGVMPDAPYSKDLLLSYLDQGRRKCRGVLAAMTIEQAAEIRRFGSIEAPLLELLLYNLRHVQHHTGQLNLMLRQSTDAAPPWIRAAASDPP